MADPRFFDNRGPFRLDALCAKIGATLPEGSDGGALVHDVATLDGAGKGQLAFCANRRALGDLPASQAGFCLIDAALADIDRGLPGILLSCRSAQASFVAAATLFYPEHNSPDWAQATAVHPAATMGANVRLGPGAVIGPGAEVGDDTSLGPNTVIGRGVAIGRRCEIAGNVTIGHALIGDRVTILPGAQIGQPGFGFASGVQGHAKVPQLGRVIIQDDVEIGACTTIDRGAIGDTVIGEGTKIDNLVQIGHNTRTGRHCIIVSQVGISGSCELGDFVVLGGQVGVADHVHLGDGARVAAKSGVPPGHYPGGTDYGGYPVRPAREWRREVATLAMLAKRRKQDRDG
jgi:UDP-3-O-[3-hydroxymyristoyl] glucosamine N-acyltransferase